jgi:hypothetical protein
MVSGIKVNEIDYVLFNEWRRSEKPTVTEIRNRGQPGTGNEIISNFMNNQNPPGEIYPGRYKKSRAPDGTRLADYRYLIKKGAC